MKKIIFQFLTFFMLSLTSLAQDLIVTNDGGSVKAYNVEVGQTSVFYTLSPNSEEIHKLGKTDILVIKKADGQKLSFDGNSANDGLTPILVQSVKVRKQYGDASLPDIDIANYKGFLLSKGNVVYILDSEIEYEQAGIDKLRELISKQGYWKLATRPEQAHFIIRYRVNLSGHDHIFQDVIGRRNEFTKQELKSNAMTELQMKFYSIHSSESITDNVEAANDVFSRLVKIQNKIDKEVPKYLLKLFTYE